MVSIIDNYNEKTLKIRCINDILAKLDFFIVDKWQNFSLQWRVWK